MKRRMTKADALDYFRKYIKPHIPKGDKVAIREAWNNYTDSLCKDGDITLKQYETWDNPF